VRLWRKACKDKCVLVPDGHHLVGFWTLRVGETAGAC